LAYGRRRTWPGLLPKHIGCLGSIGAFLLLLPSSVGADALSSALFVRTDTDHTVVVSPRARAAKKFGEATELDVSYAADIWTSASIDIAVSASKAPVTEQRDELDFALSQQFNDLTLTGSYRYSVENDYLSNGATAGGSYNFADNNATIALNSYLFADTVGRSGDPSYSRSLATVGSRLSFTQVFDRKMLGQLTYEIGHLDGFQASPYRVIGVGGTGLGCLGASYCLPEHEPGVRTRNALALLLRRALTDEISVGVNYRFYSDSWGLSSNTFALQVGWLAAEQTSVTFRYRYYMQGGVRFYLPVYPTLPAPGAFTTRDREQSPMNDHRIGVDLQQKAPIGNQGATLVFNAGLGGDFYSYDNFRGLKNSKALEVTLAVTLEK
jgi:hypothetical protein